jgi:WD40 repeat protein
MRLDFSHDSNMLLAGKKDITIDIWCFHSDEAPAKTKSIKGKTKEMYRCVLFSPDDTKIACLHDNYSVVIWDVESCKMLRTFEHHDGKIWDMQWTRGGRLRGCGEEDCELVMYEMDAEQGTQRRIQVTDDGFGMDATGCFFNKKATMLGSCALGDVMGIWDLPEEEAPVFRCLHESPGDR